MCMVVLYTARNQLQPITCLARLLVEVLTTSPISGELHFFSGQVHLNRLTVADASSRFEDTSQGYKKSPCTDI